MALFRKKKPEEFKKVEPVVEEGDIEEEYDMPEQEDTQEFEEMEEPVQPRKMTPTKPKQKKQPEPELTEEIVKNYLVNYGKRIEMLEAALFRLKSF